MRLLALADQEVDGLYSPNLLQHAPNVDCVLSAGDLPFGYLDYILTILNRPLYYVHGNHTQKRALHGSDELSEEIEGATNLHMRTVNYRGLLLAGLEGCRRYRNAEHQYSEAQMGRRAMHLALRLQRNRMRYGRALDILVTHAPPAGIHDGDDHAHRGFQAYLALMRWFRPRYLVHGHTHIHRHDQPRRTRYQDTTVLNAYGYQLITLDLPEPNPAAR